MLHGDVSPGFEPVARLVEAQLAKTRGGAAACVYHRGRCVVDVWGGARDESGAPWQRDTMAVSYSTSKGVVSTALHLLADRGEVDYDAPVARYWPAFAQAGKGGITVRDVLAHKAGLFNIRDTIDDARRMLDWDFMVEAMAAAKPEPIPVGATAYQALTYGFVIGELIRRISGRPVPRFLAEEIAAPLGLDGLYIGAPASELHRAARLIGSPARRTPSEKGDAAFAAQRRRRQRVFGAVERTLKLFGHPVDFERAAAALAPRGISTFDFSSDEVLAACIPAANGLFTARSLARLYATLGAGGTLDGTRLLSPETIARATEIQSAGYDQITIFKMRWRLGYHRVGSFRGVPPRAFGHFGWGGSGAWADPDSQVALGFVVNTGSGTPIGDLRILRINTAALACARQRRTQTASERAARS